MKKRAILIIIAALSLLPCAWLDDNGAIGQGGIMWGAGIPEVREKAEAGLKGIPGEHGWISESGGISENFNLNVLDGKARDDARFLRLNVYAPAPDSECTERTGYIFYDGRLIAVEITVSDRKEKKTAGGLKSRYSVISFNKNAEKLVYDLPGYGVYRLDYSRYDYLFRKDSSTSIRFIYHEKADTEGNAKTVKELQQLMKKLNATMGEAESLKIRKIIVTQNELFEPYLVFYSTGFAETYKKGMKN